MCKLFVDYIINFINLCILAIFLSVFILILNYSFKHFQKIIPKNLLGLIIDIFNLNLISSQI
jgi:hypothetical protein